MSSALFLFSLSSRCCHFSIDTERMREEGERREDAATRDLKVLS